MKKTILPMVLLFATSLSIATPHSFKRTDNKNIIVLVNFHVDSNYFLQKIYDTSAITLANEIFGDQLTYNLDNDFAESPYKVSFYTATEIKKNNLIPDVIVTVNLTSIQNPALSTSSFSVPQPTQHFAENTVYGKDGFTGVYNSSSGGSFGPPDAKGPYYSYSNGPSNYTRNFQWTHATVTFSANASNAHSNEMMFSKNIKVKVENSVTDDDNNLNGGIEPIFEAFYKKLYPSLKKEVTKTLQEYNSQSRN